MPVTPSNAKSTTIPRRDFLTLAWKSLLALSGALSFAGLLRFFSYEPYPAPVTKFDLGSADQFSPGTHAVIGEARSVIVYGSQGLTAYSLICPHLGCTVESAEEGFECPCHGSRFDAEGNLLQGPASQGLKPLKLEVNEAGNLILDTAA